jgi:hypothetical protein
LLYISPRFGTFFADLQNQVLTQAVNQNPEMQAMSSLMTKALAGRRPQSAAFTFVNLPDGVLASGVSSSSGQEIVGSTMAAPAGMLAAIAIPSFVKARSTAQRNACINNLRQLDSAKEQWALAENKENGAVVDEAAVLEYIRGNAMPLCPAGGTYTLGVIGENPTCSHPEHRLP